MFEGQWAILPLPWPVPLPFTPLSVFEDCLNFIQL